MTQSETVERGQARAAPQPGRAEPPSIERAIAHFGRREFDQAAKESAAILAADHNAIDALNILGVVKGRYQNDETGVALLRRALAIDPDRSDLHQNLAALLGQFGDVEEAEKHYARAIEIKPTYGEAWQGLADIRKLDLEDPLIEQLRRFADDDALAAEKRCYLNFALAKFLDGAGDHGAAFERYLAANRLRGAQYDWATHERFVNVTKATFSRRGRAFPAATGSSSVRPVFVIGMPRTGTSLVEQILASHPEIHGAGELGDITGIADALQRRHPEGVAYPECVVDTDPAAFRGFAQSYLRRIGAADPAAVRIVDKNPMNFRNLGLIERLFPNARIIHCRRDPLDTCVSCFFQNFVNGHEYSFDLDDLGRFYRSYRDLIAFWREASTLEIFDVDYEQLASEPIETSARLVAFLGLPWDEACAKPWETRRSVATASRFQVRRPVNTSSVARWRRYEGHIDPLRAALGDAAP